jgi:hypothetical protein
MNTLECLRLYGPATVREVAAHTGHGVIATRERLEALCRGNFAETSGPTHFAITPRGVSEFEKRWPPKRHRELRFADATCEGIDLSRAWWSFGDRRGRTTA